MAAGAGQAPIVTNGVHTAGQPFELSVGLPHNLGTRIHLHLTILATSIILFLSSATLDGAHAGAAMSSFIYAMPDRYNPSQPLTTSLYTQPSSQDFSARLAKVLVRRTGKLCYVGGSMNLANAVGGGTVDEEMEAFRAIVAVVATEVTKARDAEE
ncbi:hypothetical protein LTR35_005373 [Friedmanniomyces endolithicus]|uniref:Uncharacterized protein n=1 Tax=Friedmanniomyces endolithicus TaxID=329885 RepID=A0AAN6G0L3_9PEZI|nr:hypothetical protein LTR35_005373 [Friedmanniomyces endolithicus]KAK0299426.1 hypothetical protein LTS00_001869 [Friedmanniomyces endolithicus]KAK0326920.1 hypothetical protein LTR82_001680 [Friedmanniomyces endolithicus]KAK1019246.1 hypothetical protein LTR54_001061 [Friedmanniomyces endolithicus]